MSAYLDCPSTLLGTGETLVVLLKKVIPKHFKTQHYDAMYQWGQPRTGNSFVAYMKRKLTYEIDETEEHDKKELPSVKKNDENKEKKPSSKILGKMYRTSGKAAEGSPSDTSGGSSAEEGECLSLGVARNRFPNVSVVQATCISCIIVGNSF